MWGLNLKKTSVHQFTKISKIPNSKSHTLKQVGMDLLRKETRLVRVGTMPDKNNHRMKIHMGGCYDFDSPSWNSNDHADMMQPERVRELGPGGGLWDYGTS